MNVTSAGIVLSSLKYTDNQLISHIFTMEKGTIPFIVRTSNKPKSNKKKAAFQVLTFLNVEFLIKENANIQNLKDWNIDYVFHSLPYNDVKRTIVIFLAEILAKVLRDESKNETLFIFLQNSIQYFDLQEENYANFHLWFLIQLSVHIGIGPSLKKGFYFDFVEAEYTNTKPYHTNYLEKDLLGYFNHFMNIGVSDFSMVKMNRNTRHALLLKIIDFYIIRYAELSDIKSLAILTQLFA